jgi:nicotinamide mononucleotide transporter
MFAVQKQWWLVLLYGYYWISCVQGIRHWARLEKTSQAAPTHQ